MALFTEAELEELRRADEEIESDGETDWKLILEGDRRDKEAKRSPRHDEYVRYYQQRKERLIAYQKEYYRQNPERWREYNRRYKESHREVVNAKAREYYRQNKEKILAQRKLNRANKKRS